MKRYIWRIGGALVVLAVIVAAAPVFLPPGSEAGYDQTPGAGAGGRPGLITLSRPAFATGTAGVNFLKEEAGISAFTNVGREIDLVRARRAFRTIERETDEYIIGSVGVPGLGEEWDAHVFIHRDGWIVAFYHRRWPVARIIDWRDLRTTKLEAALMQVTTAAGVSIGDVNYYDFRHPEADRMMIIIDHDSFNLKIPGAFTIFERSYSFRDADIGTAGPARGSSLFINGDIIVSHALRRQTIIRTLTPAQLRPDIFHTVSTITRGQANIVAIVLVYREE